MTRSARSVLGTLSVEQFLDEYWQKEPLVVRQGFPGFEDPLTPDELAGLACEPQVDSRLIMERGGRKPWQVIPGPQRPKALQRLPQSHWTLLVESVDRHSDAVAALARAFSFLPRWRMDDVMVSLAPVHGTVEAHIDSYDVFLIQGQGRRRWEVDRRAVEAYRSGLDLRILERFRAQNSWVLEPGDFLYVPPGVGHRGVTVPSGVEIALTYSVGFRAPSTADLLSSLLKGALTSEVPHLFSDRGRRPVQDQGEVSQADLDALRSFFTGAVAADGDDWVRAVGEAVTAGGLGQPPSARVTLSSVSRRLSRGSLLSPVPGARVIWSKLRRRRAVICINGESRVLSREQAFAAPFLCGVSSPGSGRKLAADGTLLALTRDLLKAGVVAWSDQAGNRRAEDSRSRDVNQ